MTDAMLPPDDELVAAVLDGEATADERARVEADPALRARLAQFAEVRRRVAAPVTVPPDARERAMAAALAEADRLAGAVGPMTAPTPHVAPSPPPAPVAPRPPDELAARRRSGRGLQL